MSRGFWYQFPHTLYNGNDVIANIIKAIKCLYNVNVQQTEAIKAETEARMAADKELTDKIEAEAATREEADANLQNEINLEIVNRKAADYNITYNANDTALVISKGVD